MSSHTTNSCTGCCNVHVISDVVALNQNSKHSSINNNNNQTNQKKKKKKSKFRFTREASPPVILTNEFTPPFLTHAVLLASEEEKLNTISTNIFKKKTPKVVGVKRDTKSFVLDAKLISSKLTAGVGTIAYMAPGMYIRWVYPRLILV